MNRNSAIGHTWEEVERELFTPEEIAASERKVAAIGKRIEARKKMERRILTLRRRGQKALRRATAGARNAIASPHRREKAVNR